MKVWLLQLLPLESDYESTDLCVVGYKIVILVGYLVFIQVLKIFLQSWEKRRGCACSVFCSLWL